MSNTDLAVIRYLRLATISRTRQQFAGCDRFLILAGVTACRAGWLDVADACRGQVLKDNPHHLLSQWTTLPEALRSDDFQPFLRQLERFCSVEHAETLLSELGKIVDLEEEVPPKEQALRQLDDPVWNG